MHKMKKKTDFFVGVDQEGYKKPNAILNQLQVCTRILKMKNCATSSLKRHLK